MNEDQVWYLYQNGKQVGPFETQQVLQLIANKMIAQDAYIFKVGWKDWRPIEEGSEELGLATSTTTASSEELTKRRKNAPRASVNGRVIVHNNGQLAIGQGVNISASGIFVETAEQLFTIGEQLKISVRCNGISAPFNVDAKVVRYNSDSRFPIGYGLVFENLDRKIMEEIQRLVGVTEAQNETMRA